MILAYLPVSADKFETCFLFQKNIYYHRNLLTINIYIKLKRKLTKKITKMIWLCPIFLAQSTYDFNHAE